MHDTLFKVIVLNNDYNRQIYVKQKQTILFKFYIVITII